MNETFQKEKIVKLLYGVAGFVLSLLILILLYYVRPGADDFHYMIYLDDGLSGYIENTWTHYRTVNGRVLVHFILCPLLLGKMWPFRIFNLLMIFFLCYIVSRVCSQKKDQKLFVFVSSLCCLWLCSLPVISDAVLWASAALNYLFPCVLILGHYCLFQKYLEQGHGGSGLFLLSFFSAATVEMTGVLAIVTIVFFCVFRFEQFKKRKAWCMGNLICALSGFLLLFTSPGVASRLNYSEYASLSLLQRLNVNFSLFDQMICGQEGIWILVVLSLFGGACLLRSKNRFLSIMLVLSAASVVLTGTGVIYDGIAVALISLIAYLLLVLLAIWCLRRREYVIPYFIVAISVSFSVCMVSPVVAPRMMLPGAIFMIVLFCRCLCLEPLPKPVFHIGFCVLFLFAVSVLLYDIDGFRVNAQVIDENESFAEQCENGDPLYLSNVPEESFGHDTIPYAWNFSQYYLERYGIPDSEIIVSEKESPYQNRGQNPFHDLVISRGGVDYIPLRSVAQTLNADIKWESCYTTLAYENREYCFHAGGYVVNAKPGVSHSMKLKHKIRMIDWTAYISLYDAEELFPIQNVNIP